MSGRPLDGGRSLGWAVLLLLGVACRPMVNVPEGCEDPDPETCDPQPPGSTAKITQIQPPSLLSATDDARPLFGRHLEIVLDVSQPWAANQVELLCENRRLATWWLPRDQKEGTRTLRALVDLLPCRPPGVGDATVPVNLRLEIEDRLGGRERVGTFPLTLDLTAEEGELDAPGDPSALPPASLTRVQGGALGEDVYAVRLEVEYALASPPEFKLQGRPVPGSAGPQGWTVLFTAADVDFSRAAIDDLEPEVEVQAEVVSFFGGSEVLSMRIPVSRVRHERVLPGVLAEVSLTSPATWPVLTESGLVLVLSTEAGTGAALTRVTTGPDLEVQSVDIPLDLFQGICPPPGFSLSETDMCVLGLTGQGQLVVRRSQGSVGPIQVSVVREDAWEQWREGVPLTSMLAPFVGDPAPYTPPESWGRLGGTQLCAEARTESCAFSSVCLPFGRACIDGGGSVQVTPPTSSSTSFDAGPGSRAVGAGDHFVTFDYSGALSPPLLTYGTTAGGQFWRGALLPGFNWAPFNPSASAVVPVRDGIAMLQAVGPSAFLRYAPPSGTPEVEFYEPALDSAWTFDSAALPQVEPDGSLLVMGSHEGALSVSRWRPGASAPVETQALPPTEEGLLPFELGLPLLNLQSSRTFPDGTTALVYRVPSSALPWRLLVVDAQLRPILRQQGTGLFRVEQGPDGAFWILRQDDLTQTLRLQIVER